MDNSDNIYKSMINHIEDYAIIHLDIKGIITTWNKGAEKINGYLPQEVIGKNFRIFYTDEDQKNGLPEKILSEAFKNGKYTEEGWRIRKDGSIFWGDILITTHYDDKHRLTGFTKVTRDLSEKKRLDQQLHELTHSLEKKVGLREKEMLESEEKYRHLFASNPLPMWLFDPYTYQFLDVNEIACIHYGYTREEFLGMSIMDIRSDEQKEAFAKADHPIILSPHDYDRGSWQHLKKDGTRIDVELVAHDILFQGKNARMIVVNDITKRKITEEKHRKKQLDLEQAQKMAHFGHWEHVFAEGKSIWSDECCRIYGLSESDNEHSYETWLSFIHPDDIGEVLHQMALGQKTFCQTEFYHRILLRDGTVKHVFSCSRYEFDGNGKPIGMYGVVHDVSEQRSAEEKIINANRLYAVISGINQVIVQTDNEDTLFREVCNIACELGKFELGWIGRVDVNENVLHLLAHCNATENDLEVIKDLAYEKEGPVAQVLTTGTHWMANNTQSVAANSKIGSFLTGRDFRSFIVLPIKKSGSVYATLNLFSKRSDIFDQTEILLLEEVAGDISFALDVFEKKSISEQAEKKLAHSELRLRQAQFIAHVGSWELDFSVGVAVWSEEHCRIYGLEGSDNRHSFESWLSFIHPEDAQFVRTTIEGSGILFNHASFFHRIIRKDGSLRHIYMHSQYEMDNHGNPVGLYGVSHDVTESKEAENLLKQSEMNLRLIMDLLPQRIFVKDSAGKYLFVNKSFGDLYGKGPKELINASRKGELFSGKNNDTFKRDDRQVISEGRKKIIPEEIFIGPTGEKKIFHVTKLPYFWGRTREESVLGILNDITEQKRAESERSALLDDVVRRNESLEQFAYIISHNLRAPVSNILALSALLQTAMEDPEGSAKILDSLLMSTERLDGVIKDLNTILKTTHQSTETKEKIRFSDICSDVRASLSNAVENEQDQIVTDFSAVDEFYGTKSYLYSIFYNLISNSIKYRRPNVDLIVKVFSEYDKDKIKLIFVDNGLGMDLNRYGYEIFGLYKRFHTHVEGKGMGLYMVKRHVEIMGGKIEVISKINEGSTFSIVFNN